MSFNPNDPAFIRDPYPTLAQLHAEMPIFWHEPSQMWFVVTHEDLTTLLKDRRLGRQITHIISPAELGLPPRNPEYAPFDMLSDNSMFDKEPPEHTRIKNLVHKVFTPRRVESLRGEIRAICEGLLDTVQAQGIQEMDLLNDYAVPLPVAVIAELLGIPQEDRHRLRPWSAAIVRMYELEHSPETARKAIQAASEFSDYLRYLSRERRNAPQEDLISALVSVEDHGEILSENELISTCILLLNAGHEATVNAFGNGMWGFFQNPDQFDLLKSRPQLLNSAVEEMLRFDAPVQLFRRWVLEDMEYKGHPFKLGQEVAFLFGGANRDPKVFPNPNQFDITRDPNPHITFSVGIHYCLGAPLARLELQTSLGILLERLPNIEVAETPEFHPAFVIRGLKSLPVRW